MSRAKPRVRIERARPEHAEALEALQRTCFPNLAAHELMTRAHFLEHQERFPEGEFVAIAADAPDGTPLPQERVVGLGSGFLIDFDVQRPEHSFHDIIAGGTYANHDPNGAWYYGADISVHPDYRNRGLGRALYDARKGLVRRLGRRGIVGGGQLPGYPRYRDELTLTEYVEQVVAGNITDPTLTFQLSNGFEVYGIIDGYIEDEYTDDRASFIVWFNPDLLFPEPG
ncbi:MAG: GNAT family N-acetyltransferase [Trueperaceae bacterium]|nr:GNAT family N-acetyltransferase [Truepera sp.]